MKHYRNHLNTLCECVDNIVDKLKTFSEEEREKLIGKNHLTYHDEEYNGLRNCLIDDLDNINVDINLDEDKELREIEDDIPF
jgi:hypothetical protein